MDITRIPILNYHKIEKKSDIGITSRTPTDFENDIRLLKENGYQFIDFRDVQKGSLSPGKYIILTFDDGYESVFTNAYPVLKRYSATACIFIPVNYIGNYNDWDVQFGNQRYKHLDIIQIHELLENGYEIGSHGLSHHSFVHMKPEHALYEINSAKRQLEALFNVPVSALCYPFRKFNSTIMQMVKEAGYHYGIASQKFYSVSPDFVNYALPRINVYRPDRSVNIVRRVEHMRRFRYRDWLIQQGASATILYQKIIKSKEVRGRNE